MDAKISVIIPAYNSEKWIRKCVQSVAEQTYRNLEIIIINDGSTDRTGIIADAIAKDDPRIVVYHQKNKGLVLTRETGISLAQGDYIAFVDSDDTIEPDMYERLVANALKYDADISHCGLCFHQLDGAVEYHYNTGRVVVQDNVTGVKDLLEGQFIEPSLCNKLYRKELCINSCLDTSIVNNEDLLRNFVLFGKSEKSVFEDFCGYNYVKHDNSLSTDAQTIKVSRCICKARRTIVENSSYEYYPYAVQCWLSGVVNAVNIHTFKDDAESSEFCKECRRILKAERKNIHHLIPRQRLAAWLIVISPMVHRWVYTVYQKKQRRIDL